MVGAFLLLYLVIVVVVCVLFYKWGAHIAESKGRSRALGWWAVFFTWIAIIILYVLPDQSTITAYAPSVAHPVQPVGVSDHLAKLASLRESGALTEEEFQRAKADALARI
jgi:putative oligomerization/nucleic acid binding protein